MKKKKRARGWILFILLAAVTGLGGYIAYDRFFAAEDAAGVAYVQSVAEIAGIGSVGRANRYSGVVEARNVVRFNPDPNLTIRACHVTVGQKVDVGTPLFSYDTESLRLSTEQLRLDILGLDNSIQSGEEKVALLEKKLKKARESKKYDIEIEIQTAELGIRKNRYERTEKEKQLKEQEAALQNSTVLSTVAGTVRSVRNGELSASQGYGDGSTDTDYITVVAGNDYCVRGTVSEQTVHSLYEGMPVRLLSRVDANVWKGRIYAVNTDEPQANTNRYYGDSDERATRYDFYVEIEGGVRLLMGQHLYIEPGDGEAESGSSAPRLPSFYILRDGSGAYVYAANAAGRIERRAVTLGAYMEEADTYEVLSGLTIADRIAYPDESVAPGMSAVEAAYAPEEADGAEDDSFEEMLPAGGLEG